MWRSGDLHLQWGCDTPSANAVARLRLGIPLLGFVVSVVVQQGLYYIVERWRAKGGAM